MKCTCRFAASLASAIALAAIVTVGAYEFGFVAVNPKPVAKTAVSIDMTPLTQPAAPTPVAAVGSAAGGGGATAAAQGPGPILKLLAGADIEAGQKYAKACAACHSFNKGEPARIGPNLYGIIGSNHAHMAGFAYSAAMKSLSDKVWTFEELNLFLYKPSVHIQGTKMTFAGIKADADRANVIAWLRTLSDQPVPLPKD